MYVIEHYLKDGRDVFIEWLEGWQIGRRGRRSLRELAGLREVSLAIAKHCATVFGSCVST
jgi:hypothetical protein